MMFGLETKDVERIVAVFRSFPAVEKAIIYGSRVKGNYREGSDIDVCLVGPQLNLSVMNAIAQSIYDLNLPYLFDMSVYHQISNPDFKEHINRVGTTLFDKKNRPGKTGTAYNV